MTALIADTMRLSGTQTVSGAKTFNSGTLLVSGSAGEGLNINRGTTVDTTAAPVPLLVQQTITTTPTTSAPNYPTVFIPTSYNATQATDPFDIGYQGIYSLLNYGTGPAGINPKGSALGISSNVVIAGSGHVNNETSNWFGVARADNAAQNSIWFTDFNVHGPIGAQPGLLTGINMFMGNYYNGSPSRANSYAFCVATKPQGGGGGSAAHSAATMYKLDYGIGIQGYAGTIGSPTRGFEVGVNIGGSGSNWVPSGSSKIGTGIKLSDIEATGIDFSDSCYLSLKPSGNKDNWSNKGMEYVLGPIRRTGTYHRRNQDGQ